MPRGCVLTVFLISPASPEELQALDRLYYLACGAEALEGRLFTNWRNEVLTYEGEPRDISWFRKCILAWPHTFPPGAELIAPAKFALITQVCEKVENAEIAAGSFEGPHATPTVRAE